MNLKLWKHDPTGKLRSIFFLSVSRVKIENLKKQLAESLNCKSDTHPTHIKKEKSNYKAFISCYFPPLIFCMADLSLLSSTGELKKTLLSGHSVSTSQIGMSDKDLYPGFTQARTGGKSSSISTNKGTQESMTNCPHIYQCDVWEV